MEIKVYSLTLYLVGIIENFTSLLWHRKYDECGEFELHVPITSYHISYLQRGNIVSYDGAKEAGVIESIKITQDNKESEYVVEGRFLESYFDRRLIYAPNTYAYNFSGYTEVAMRTIITNAAAIPLLELGDLQGFTEEVTFQATFQNLLKYESKLAKSAGFGFRCEPNFTERKIVFKVYKGLDHSEGQASRVRVVFSESYKNLNEVIYTENDQLLKTVCYVGGRGEGANRVWVIVGDDTLTGLERREVKLNVTDIDDTGLSDAEYLEKLRQRGESLLINNDIMIQSFESETIPNGNFVYKTHYDLGDIVTVKKESWGISLNLRITELEEIYENGTLTIEPTFGKPIPDTIDWEDK